LTVVIDLHCHLLPGIDDGPATIGEAVAMARVAREAGTRTVVCTPHMIDRYPTDPARIDEGVRELRAALDDEGIDLRVVGGAEIALDHLPRMSDADLAMASIDGAGRWLLLEMPFHGWPLRLPEILRDLEIRGYGVILAHPERAEAIQRSPDRMRDIVGRGALVQLTAGSFLGEHGPAARRTALMLLAGGAAHLLASDAHSAGPWRPPGLEAGLNAAADAIDAHPQTLSWMVNEGPEAILGGGPVRPPRLIASRPPPPPPPRASGPSGRGGPPGRGGRPAATRRR
jgi:protein-tyrosine phosphatase